MESTTRTLATALVVLLTGGILGGGLLARRTLAAPSEEPPARDTDGDGLSDFEETQKYRTDPMKADSDGDGIPDGDWNERREYTYSIRCLVSHMAPAHAVSDGWQDARELHREGNIVELEIIAYPLATPHERRAADGRQAQPKGPLGKYVQPNLTNDFDPALRKEILAALKKDGIDTAGPRNRAFVEQVARWAMKRVKTGSTGFTICYVTAKDGQLTIEKGLETRAKTAQSDPKRSLEEQLDIEVRGASMVRRCRCGSCTSTAVYLQTILRALGVPTRTTVAMPPIDAGSRQQRELLASGLRSSALRDGILKGAGRGGGGWTEHTINVVWVGDRWMRLNYSKLGQPIVDPVYLGLMLRILDYGDRATAGTAATWGRRWALRTRSTRWPNGNPYSLLSISDRMGAHAVLQLEAGAPRTDRAHKKLTITAARWSTIQMREGALLECDCAEWFEGQDGDQYKRFTSKVDSLFLLQADGLPDVRVHCGSGSITGRNFHAVPIYLDQASLDQLRQGVPYRIVPRNGSGPLKWAVRADVTVQRD